MSKRKFCLAQKEFKNILRADNVNAGAILGLGEVTLQRRDFKKAKKYFSSALRFSGGRLFSKIRPQILSGLAKTEFSLGNFRPAKKLLRKLIAVNPLEPGRYYLLGRVYEREKEFNRASLCYKDVLRLGFGGIEPISRLLKIFPYLKEKESITKYVISRYKVFKKRFNRVKALRLKKKNKIKGLGNIEKRLNRIANRLALRITRRINQCKKEWFCARIRIWLLG